jgi:hypothetical protein
MDATDAMLVALPRQDYRPRAAGTLPPFTISAITKV